MLLKLVLKASLRVSFQTEKLIWGFRDLVLCTINFTQLITTLCLMVVNAPSALICSYFREVLPEDHGCHDYFSYVISEFYEPLCNVWYLKNKLVTVLLKLEFLYLISCLTVM